MDKAKVPIAYVQRLTAYLAGETVDPLLALFSESACIERYVLGEQPRVHCGLEQIEESLLRLPATGGSFHVADVRQEAAVVHARFFTRDFPYPLQGFYRFELTSSGQIARLYISARYSAAEQEGRRQDPS